MNTMRNVPSQLLEVNETGFPRAFICPASKTLLIDPVKVQGDCEHTVNRNCFLDWILQGNTTCPVCKEPLKDLFPMPDDPLIKAMEDYRTRKTKTTTQEKPPELVKKTPSRHPSTDFSPSSPPGILKNKTSKVSSRNTPSKQIAQLFKAINKRNGKSNKEMSKTNKVGSLKTNPEDVDDQKEKEKASIPSRRGKQKAERIVRMDAGFKAY